jgi:hypothetical protein
VSEAEEAGVSRYQIPANTYISTKEGGNQNSKKIVTPDEERNR